MGGSSWSDDHYKAASATRAASGKPTFAYNADVKSGKVAAAVHKTLDVKGVKMRESRDSDAHPKSRAVAVLLDVTGSMSSVPGIVQEKLPSLMGLLIRKGHLADPHIMVGAIGDAKSDRYPIQIGQFEAGIEIDEQITSIILEGNGGGSGEESYELAMWFMLHRTSIDCFEKRGEKGFLFIVGDERFYPTVKASEIERFLGDAPKEDQSTPEMIKQLKEKYEVFYVMPNMTQHYQQDSMMKPWKACLGQNVLLLDEPSGICELIASTIALHEGSDLDSVAKDLSEAGTSMVTADAVSRALATYSTTVEGKANQLAIPSSGEPSGLVEV